MGYGGGFPKLDFSRTNGLYDCGLGKGWGDYDVICRWLWGSDMRRFYVFGSFRVIFVILSISMLLFSTLLSYS